MELRDQLQATLGDSYRIERELGGGGMSRVFLGEERRFGRKVVIKVLPPDVAGAVSAERFEREIQLAARLQHPNIVPLLTAGDADGLLYYTMPFVQGETLRDRVTREHRIPIADALRIASEVADALTCAHGAGVVHRDIKPENILLSAGHAMVADFGIAKAISAAKTVSDLNGDHSLTQLGTSLGTPAYMSPEQAAGEANLDGRTDIYSLACVLYEMLAGRQPFTGPTAAAVIAKRFAEIPAPLRTIDERIPVAVERLVTRAMARDPDDRFPAAIDLLDELSATSASRSGPAAAHDDKPSVAVLPFTNLSSNAEDEYFSDGMTDEVINVLARVPSLRVAARTSAFAFKGQRLDLRTIAQQLHVRSVLEGTVRRAGNRVRISVQLVGADDGLHLWSERYDRELADVFALQDEIAQAIAQALDQRLGGPAISQSRPIATMDDHAAARAAVDPAAYDEFLRGRFLFEQHAGLDATACFERVVAMDPNFAPCHAWLAHANMLSANINLQPALIGYTRGRAAADRALELDPQLPAALVARCAVATWFDWDRPLGESLAREVVALAPGWPISHEFVGWTSLMDERYDVTAQAIQDAMALDPLSDFMVYNCAVMLAFAGEPAKALDLMRPALARSPGKGGMQLLYGTVLFIAGRLEEARTTLERAYEVTPVGALYQGSLVCVRAAMGDTDLARVRLIELAEQVERGKESAVEVACGYHSLGDETSAYQWFERGFQARALGMAFLHVEPRFKSLRETQRFEALLKRVGVAPRG